MYNSLTHFLTHLFIHSLTRTILISSLSLSPFPSSSLPPLFLPPSPPPSRLVRLMTAGTHNAERLAAELLFTLCKENSSRLIKYTGYGNAAGLLFAHGLLSGGRSEGEGDYSSDSETSDTEEYIEERPW